jgi:glutamyl-tRNA reductase
MPLVLLGLNHRSAPLPLREKFAWSSTQLAELLPAIKAEFQSAELVVLSTCNRTEFYVEIEDTETLHRRATEFLGKRAPEQPLEPYLYVREEGDVVKHLFRVAAGLDSMVVGENEVLGQVKTAYLMAQQAGCTGKLTNVLFQRSLYAGKRVRTETGISMGASSVGSVAVILAERIFGSLAERVVMILGAGKMAELTARHLLSQKVHSILVSNRTFERAQELAALLGGRALSFDDGLKEMDSADIVICSTAAPHAVIVPEAVEEIMRRRKGRSLFFIDIAVPRDVHPEVEKMDNVYVYNVDDLQSIVQENLGKRGAQVETAEALIAEKAAEFTQWLAAYRAGEEFSFQHATSVSKST